MKRIPLASFTRQEMRDFLALHTITLPPGEFQRLYTASQGNPLYLYYFTQQQISPLPEDLEDYQRVLWEKLSPPQQEALAFLAHSLIPLRVDDLHDLLNGQQALRTMMETKSLLTSAAPIVHLVNEAYEFFHARFAEYIRAVIAHDGLSSHYHQLLGERALRKQWVVATAYHLLNANDPRVEAYLVSGAQIALLQGEYQLAERFLLRALQPQRENVQEQPTSPDIYIAYEEGVRRLLRRLDQDQPQYADALIYQQRLVENTTQTRLYGDTETRRAERAEIIDQLTKLTRSAFNRTILDICKEQEPLQAQTTKGMKADAPHQEAYIRYLLAQVYLELGRYADARREVDASIVLFETAKEGEWKALVELWSNLLLLEEGQSQPAIEALERALKANQIQDVFAEAYLQLNLSYAYLHVSRFRQGAEAAKRAADLFNRLEDTRGVYVSLTNLAGNIGHLGAHTLQREYAEQIIQAATQHHLLRLRCAGLNLLAVAQRSLGDPLAAQVCLEECIRIGQEIGSVELEVLNIINLGNALRDQKLETQADSAYAEALTMARQNHLPKHEAHALELLARSKFSQGCYEEAIELGVAALALQLPLGEHI